MLTARARVPVTHFESALGIGVIGPQCLLPDCQGADVERLCLGIGALFGVQLPKVVEVFGGPGVIRPQVLFSPGELFFLNLRRLLIFALLVEGIHLVLLFENLWRPGAPALPTGLGQQLMGTQDLLLASEQGRRLYRLRLRSHSGTGKPRWLATTLSPAGLCSHSGRWSTIQQNPGECDATPKPMLCCHHPSSKNKYNLAPLG